MNKRSNGKILLRIKNNLSIGLNLLFESTLKPHDKPHSELIKRSIFVIRIDITTRRERKRQKAPKAILKGVTNLRNLEINRQDS